MLNEQMDKRTEATVNGHKMCCYFLTVSLQKPYQTVVYTLTQTPQVKRNTRKGLPQPHSLALL